MPNTYKQQWGGTHPGCMIFLLDQSGSMYDNFGQAQAGGGKRKCDMVATILNGFLNELIALNSKPKSDGTMEIRPRADIAVLGYEGNNIQSVLASPLTSKAFVTLPELQINPLSIEKREKIEIDETGQQVKIPVSFPIWVKPKAAGGTPMCAALRKARDLAQQWAASHQNHYPPVIINVTDGMAGDGDPVPVAREIAQVSTSDGQALLFNVHITELNVPQVAYPASEAQLPNDTYAKQLFQASSPIPESSRTALEKLINQSVPPGSKGMIFNGDASSIRLMFNFASIPGTVPAVDPNR